MQVCALQLSDPDFDITVFLVWGLFLVMLRAYSQLCIQESHLVVVLGGDTKMGG